MKNFFQKHTITVLLLLLLSLPLTLQLFQPGFFVGDDGEWMIIRSSAFHEALRDGQFPVRFLGRLNHEFGYPVATFLYPGYLYLTEPFVIAGFSFIESIKIMFTLTMVTSGLFAYFWLNKIFDKWSSLVGALVYLYTPYHLVDMYVRGSLGELLALAVVPFILWNIERRSIIFSVLGLALLILSHNIMAALFLPIILVYTFMRYKGKIKEKIIITNLLLIFGLGVSAFFWIPALFELSNTVFNQTKISEWQNYFATYAQIGGLSLTIIVTSVLIALLRKFFSYKNTLFQANEYNTLLYLFSAVGAIAVFFSSSWSATLWNVLPVSFIQFPFRFLSVEVVAVAFLAGFILYGIKNKVFKIVYTAIILVALSINAMPYLTNINSFDKGEGFYFTNQSTTTTRDEYMPVWVKEKPVERVVEKIQIIKGKAEISNSIVNNKTISFNINATDNTLIQVNKIYWPGWIASIDGHDATINYDNPKGLMTISLPDGNHAIKLTFLESPLRIFANSVSIISFIIVLLLVFTRKKASKSNKK